MPEELSQGSTPQGDVHTYPQKQSMATPAFANGSSPLLEKIRAQIEAKGSIKFRDYMQMALYDPAFGYYVSESQKVGKQGDFITSVSVGRCFGLILAHRLLGFWMETGEPDTFHIIEPGSHNGALCADILNEVASYSPRFFDAVHYHLIEASSSLRQAQQATLEKRFKGKFSIHQSLGEIPRVHGAIISNELVDSFPVDLVKFEDGKWWQLYVCVTDGKLEFIRQRPSDEDLRLFCTSLGDQFPDGYVTEFNPGIKPFMRDASSALESGLMITIDYGHHAEEYYHPDRSTGTLQTYHRHRKSDHPLEYPGEIDITSHVDFSHLISEAEAVGFSAASLVSQASYLTTHARDWLVSMEGHPADDPDSKALLRQFQTLTHPAMLGNKFMVLEMKKTPGNDN